MLYLAQPYYNPYLPIREARYRDSLTALYQFYKAGIIAYSPIAHWHPTDSKYDRELENNREYLMSHSKSMIKLSWGLVVLDMDGWMISGGIYQEWKQAKKLNKFTGLVDWRRLKDGDIIAKPLGDYRKGGYGALSKRTWGPEGLKGLHKEIRANTAHHRKQKS